MHDVYAYGVIAPSTLIELRSDHPVEGGYAEIAQVHPSVGGEAAGGAYVLARLGVSTKLVGNRLGADAASARVVAVLTGAGVDCSSITQDGDTPSVTEFVVTAGAARTVFGTFGKLAAEQAWDEPSEDDVAASRIVCLDPFFGDASYRVARWCVKHGVPYVVADTGPVSTMAAEAAAVIVSEEFAAHTLGVAEPREAVAAYTDGCRGLVVLTRGSGPVLYGRMGGVVREFAPFPIRVRDTTGAGDSFRAGLIYAMLHGHEDADAVRIGSAVAALVCERAPSFLDSPSEAELRAFLDAKP